VEPDPSWTSSAVVVRGVPGLDVAAAVTLAVCGDIALTLLALASLPAARTMATRP
jgi:hypothetical protein